MGWRCEDDSDARLKNGKFNLNVRIPGWGARRSVAERPLLVRGQVAGERDGQSEWQERADQIGKRLRKLAAFMEKKGMWSN